MKVDISDAIHFVTIWNQILAEELISTNAKTKTWLTTTLMNS